jgi:Crp-like helix-turn-helix domain
MENGTDAEMGLVGNDGVVGIALFLGGSTTPNRAVVQIAGRAFRMSARVLHQEFARFCALHDGLLRYTQVLITQISQTAVCNRLHSVEQRLCRWLLLSHDRVESDEIAMTQEVIASMLGGRRESVAIAAGHLQDVGLIQYARGHIVFSTGRAWKRRYVSATELEGPNQIEFSAHVKSRSHVQRAHLIGRGRNRVSGSTGWSDVVL